MRRAQRSLYRGGLQRAASRDQPSRETLPALRTLLVSDLVEFAATIQALGDYRGLDFIREHNALLRSCLRQELGTEVTHTGDGMIMSFASADRALRCAARIQQALTDRNARAAQPSMRIRIGLHAGRPHDEENRLFGSCVNVAVRVCSAACSQQVLISGDVLSLIDLGGDLMTPLGPTDLRGICSPVDVYEFNWQQAVSDLAATASGKAA